MRDPPTTAVTAGHNHPSPPDRGTAAELFREPASLLKLTLSLEDLVYGRASGQLVQRFLNQGLKSKVTSSAKTGL
jgi:hypothetical protein